MKTVPLNYQVHQVWNVHYPFRYSYTISFNRRGEPYLTKFKRPWTKYLPLAVFALTILGCIYTLLLLRYELAQGFAHNPKMKLGAYLLSSAGFGIGLFSVVWYWIVMLGKVDQLVEGLGKMIRCRRKIQKGCKKLRKYCSKFNKSSHFQPNPTHHHQQPIR